MVHSYPLNFKLSCSNASLPLQNDPHHRLIGSLRTFGPFCKAPCRMISLLIYTFLYIHNYFHNNYFTNQFSFPIQNGLNLTNKFSRKIFRYFLSTLEYFFLCCCCVYRLVRTHQTNNVREVDSWLYKNDFFWAIHIAGIFIDDLMSCGTTVIGLMDYRHLQNLFSKHWLIICSWHA